MKDQELAKLLAAYYWIGIRAAHESNSKRGLTKKTTQEEERIIKQLCKRLDLDMEEMLSLIRR